MKSHEILKSVVESVGAKSVAHDLRVSTSLVYKWCAEPPSEFGDEASGARNPLDRVLELIAATKDRRPIEWLCHHAGGYYVEATELEDHEVDQAYIQHTQQLLGQFSELLQLLSTSLAHENRIDPKEAYEIRRQWNQLQGLGEAFVRACEDGAFDPTR